MKKILFSGHYNPAHEAGSRQFFKTESITIAGVDKEIMFLCFQKKFCFWDNAMTFLFAVGKSKNKI